MENEVKPSGTIEPVNDGHEAVLVGVGDLCAWDLRLLKPSGVVDDDVSTGLLGEGFQPLAANDGRYFLVP
jgi:hypothetical protein